MSVEEQLTGCKIGESHEVISLRDEDEIRQAAIHLANQAEREILILSQELDPAIFGHHEFTDELRSFIHNRNSKMRILVTMDRKLIRGSHRMVTMARKFSSTIAIHRLDPRKRSFRETAMLCDEVALLLRPNPELSMAIMDCDTPGGGNKMKTQFESLWNNSEPIPEIGTLGV